MAVSPIKESSNRTMSGTASKTIAVHTTATVTSVDLPEGKWIICSHMKLGASGTSVYNHIVGSQIVRTSEANGGGSMNMRLINGPSTQNIQVYHNLTNGCTVDVTWFAVKLL